MSYCWSSFSAGGFGEWGGHPDDIIEQAKKSEKQRLAIDLAFSPISTIAKNAIKLINKAPTEEEKVTAIIEKVLLKHGLIKLKDSHL